MFDDVLGPGRTEQAMRSESKKNQKKGIKRTLKPESTTSLYTFSKSMPSILHLSHVVKGTRICNTAIHIECLNRIFIYLFTVLYIGHFP